jgi:hypothetical protein
MPKLTEVFFTKSKERRAVELRISPHEVISMRMQRPATCVEPCFLRVITSFKIYSLGTPVIFFTRDIVSTFKQQNLFAGGSESVSECAAASSRPDDDDVVVITVCHFSLRMNFESLL